MNTSCKFRGHMFGRLKVNLHKTKSEKKPKENNCNYFANYSRCRIILNSINNFIKTILIKYCVHTFISGVEIRSTQLGANGT